MTHDARIDPATGRVLATIDDTDQADRYPDPTHFISAANPDQGELATRALAASLPSSCGSASTGARSASYSESNEL